MMRVLIAIAIFVCASGCGASVDDDEALGARGIPATATATDGGVHGGDSISEDARSSTADDAGASTTADAEVGCPPTLPSPGSPCVDSKTICGYGSGCGFVFATCNGGVWAVSACGDGPEGG